MIIESIQSHHDGQIAQLIRDVLADFGAARPGFAWADPQLDQLSQFYQGEAMHYWVVLDENGGVVGGAGIGPLAGETQTCELQKMYLRATVRGQGVGQQLMDCCLDFARQYYRYCYLETLKQMDAAQRLYQRNGFVPLSEPLGATGHGGCDSWYRLDLSR